MRYLDDSDKFRRVLIGVGRPPGERGTGIYSWVLGTPSEEDQTLIYGSGFEKAWAQLSGMLTS